MTDYNDGKIHGWNGGDRPVHPLSLVKVFQRGILSSFDYKANNVYWGHNNSSSDIVAFQVVKEYKEPMVLWTNLYSTGLGPVYKTEQDAMFAAVHGVDRVAVKFIEVQE